MSTNKTSAPVLGFNHNVIFGPRKYHVQTEDSGLPHAHYITHLFVGGNVLASMKSSYAEQAGSPDLAKTVRALMEAQHKKMLKRLVSGEFSERAQLFAPSYEPGVLATGQTSPEAMNVRRTEPAAASSLSRASPQPAPAAARPPPARPASIPSPPFFTEPSLPPVHRPLVPNSPRKPGAPLPFTTRAPPVMRPVQPPMVAPVAVRGSTPPLSKNPFVPELFAAEKAVEVPADDIPVLFAEELISEKSLDEVILAFLSADLEQGK